MVKNILTDGDLLILMEELEMDNDYYWFGAYTEYNDLDVPNLVCYCGYLKDNELKDNENAKE